MINLIPPSAQQQVKKEYWLRVISVWMILIASALLIVAILNIPVYVLVRSQLDAFSTEFAQANLKSESFDESELAVKQANGIANLLVKSDVSAPFTSVLAEIESLGGNGIVITEVMISSTEGKLDPIGIKGMAPTRLSLTTFQNDLEAHGHFKNVVLPLSNLARDKDIVFNITAEPEITPR
jgi:hypothetical protein